MNPNCPEPKCHRVMRTRKLKTDLGIAPCPNCRGNDSKKYILTSKKEGMRKCMRCRKDFYPQRREGLGRFFICPEHPWQKFRVGSEVILCKERPTNWRKLAGIKKAFQATKRKQPNVQMRPRA
jgi:hypothetical protein